jgi:ABC-type nitrate/sulfonate/bicarbonate transport system permease component
MASSPGPQLVSTAPPGPAAQPRPPALSASPSVFSRLPRVNLPGIAFMLGATLCWELLVRSQVIQLRYFPAPSEVASAAGPLIRSGELGTAALHTTGVSLMGWAVGSVVGIILGTAMGSSATIWRWTAASVEFLRAIPSVTLVPLAVLLFGFSRQMELVLIIYGCLWMVLVGTMHAFARAPDALVQTGRTLGLSRAKTIFSILAPHGVPTILVSLRLALSLALILAVAAEMIGNPAGLGAGIIFAQEAFRPADTFVFLLAIGLIGVSLNALFRAITLRVFRPQIQAAERNS